jgi:hypothetical protein
MADEPDWALHPLEIDDEESRNIGGFIIQWGNVEYQLNNLVPILFRIDPTLATCITANLGTKAKVEMLQSALTMISPVLPAERVTDLHETLEMTLEFSSRYRNMLAHGGPFFEVNEEAKETTWRWARYAARKQVSIIFPNHGGNSKMPESDSDFWAMAGGLLWIVIEGLFSNGKALYPIIQAITPERWEEVCTIRDEKP